MLLCDLFYLPFEHGSRGLRLMHDFHWLTTHAASILQKGNKSEVNHSLRVEVDNSDVYSNLLWFSWADLSLGVFLLVRSWVEWSGAESCIPWTVHLAIECDYSLWFIYVEVAIMVRRHAILSFLLAPETTPLGLIRRYIFIYFVCQSHTLFPLLRSIDFQHCDRPIQSPFLFTSSNSGNALLSDNDVSLRIMYFHLC